MYAGRIVEYAAVDELFDHPQHPYTRGLFASIPRLGSRVVRLKTDFGYHVAESVPDFDDLELLQPRRLYERQGRTGEYTELVERLKTERVARLQEFPELSDDIVKAAG
jgi:ABC-type dipeptide/oligopeptide/nickel transport system ATPase component